MRDQAAASNPKKAWTFAFITILALLGVLCVIFMRSQKCSLPQAESANKEQPETASPSENETRSAPIEQMHQSTQAPQSPQVTDLKKIGDRTDRRLDGADGVAARMHPTLARALQDYKEGKEVSLPPPVFIVDKTMPNADVTVILHEGRDLPKMEGVVFRSRAGSIVGATGSLPALERLARHDAVRYLELASPQKPKNDTAVAGSLAVIGQIASLGQVDDYTYFALAGERITVRVHASDDPPTLDAAVEIHDLTPTLLIGDDDSGPGLDARLTFTFPATAQYTIRVGSLVASSGPYHLILESSEAASTSFLTGGDITGGNQVRYIGSSVVPVTTAGVVGNNVLIGIIDSGIAWHHQDLISPGGTSRILFLWDQGRSDGPAPDVGGDQDPVNDYGVEYPRSTINGWIANLPSLPPSPWPGFDASSHGTAVAGAAAGDGSDTDGGEPSGRYRGVSTGSDILFVRLGSNGGIIDGLAYLATKAVELGRPIVINISLGSNIGPHDGKGAEAQVVDAISGPGRIIVVAAGNEGVNKIHARTVIGAGLTANLGYTILTPTDCDVDIWADSGDQFTATVSSPGAQVLSATSGNASSGTLDGWTVTISNRQGGPSALNGDTRIYVNFVPPASPPASPIPGWTISLTRTASAGTGQIDAFASVGGSGGEFTTFVPAGGEPLSVAGTLTDLSTSSSAITVGAYASKYRWDSDVGTTQTNGNSRNLFSSIAFFSSRGPTRKNATKPDITAPGNVVATAFSQESLGGATDPLDVSVDGRHRHLSGTSFASPHVAGIIALLLEKNGYLTPAQVRTALQASAYLDQSTGNPISSPNSWGGGKVNAPGALTAAPAPPANTFPPSPTALEQLDNASSPLALGASISSNSVKIRATLTDAQSQYVKLQIEVKPLGTAFDGLQLVDSPYVMSGDVATVTITGLANGSYHWRARTMDSGGGASSPALFSLWSAFGGNLESESDFQVSVPSGGGGGGGGGGGCGLTGVEWLLLLLGLRLRGRKKGKTGLS